jgi:lysophospholipase L1-like esterase
VATTKKRKGSKVTATDASSIAAGKNLAKVALAVRAKQRRTRQRRAAELERRPARSRARESAARVKATDGAMLVRRRSLFGAPSRAGVLIAEGDSWFDYPGTDVLRLLEDEHLFDVESVAHMGDRVEDMAHSDGQFEAFARRLEKLLRENKVPRAVLLSGGGNDIAGEDFAVLLNHRSSRLPVLNDDIARGVIDVRLRAAYTSMIAGITEIARAYLRRPLPIVTHGYGYAVPDGRGFWGGFWFLPGPWLEPGFRKKQHEDTVENRRVVAALIDRFNTMLSSVRTLPGFSHVHHVDLRRVLTNGSGYKRDWANELHPTEDGFARVASEFARVLARL